MSTVIQRRREAATFLAGYAGAPGELIVDETNNRVQVHDGTTLGGFPAAGIRDILGHNAGINTNFGINQRTYVSGTSLAAGVYAHDRHKAGSGGCTYTFTQGVVDTTITITAGTLVQAIDAPNVYATAFWLTWTGTSTARVWQSSASGTFSAGTPMTIEGVTVNALLVTGLTIGTITNVEFSTGTLGTTRPWQLEAALPNAGPTRLERRHGELALCQRYYKAIQGAGGDIAIAIAQSNSVNIFLGDVSAMRTVPTLTHNLTDANYVSSEPSGAQWAMSQPGFDFAAKSGTVSFIATPGPFSAYLTVVGPFSPLPISLALGPTARLSLSAEI